MLIWRRTSPKSRRSRSLRVVRSLPDPARFSHVVVPPTRLLMLLMATSKPTSTFTNLPLRAYARCDAQHKIALCGGQWRMRQGGSRPTWRSLPERVSTDSQTLQAQTEALHAAGCARIFAEKISGAYSDRPQLAKAIAALGDGDTLVVCKLDRLARPTRDLLNTLDAIGKAGFKSLGDAWC